MRFNKKHLLVYAVTGRAATDKELFYQVEEALEGGATMIQFRKKGLGGEHSGDALNEALELRRLTEVYSVPFIVDNDLELALACGADGLHVGQDDLEAGFAREMLGDDRILGVTARSVGQARKAQEQGADYLGSGAVFGTKTKADACPMTIDLLKAICSSVTIPVVAIGGINLVNIKKLAGSKVAGAAIVSGIFGATDIKGTTEKLMKAVQEIIV